MLTRKRKKWIWKKLIRYKVKVEIFCVFNYFIVWDPLFKSNDSGKNNPVYFFEVTNWLSPFQVSFLAIFIILPIWAKWRMIVDWFIFVFEILYYFSYLLSLVALNSISWKRIIANGGFLIFIFNEKKKKKKEKNYIILEFQRI